ncbi:hypothetical protein [Desulfosporosinus fructosivorans]
MQLGRPPAPEGLAVALVFFRIYRLLGLGMVLALGKVKGAKEG